MARLFSSGFELGEATGSGAEWAQSFQNQGSRSSGTRSGNFVGVSGPLTSGSAQYFGHRFVAANADGPYYFRIYLNVATLPSAQNRIIALYSTTSVSVVHITLDSGGLLRLFDEDGQIGSASSALSLNTWYRIEIKYDRTPAAGSQVVEAQIDGTNFATSSTRNLSVGIADLRVGCNLATEAQSTGAWSWDDVAINDSTGSFQTGYPGVGYIVHVRPTGTGDAVGFLTVTGGTTGTGGNATRVKEVLPNDATSFNASVTSGAEDLFYCDSITNLGPISLVQVGFRFTNNTADATTAIKVEVMKISGGTKAQSAAIIPNSTTWFTNASAVPRNYPLTLYQDPDAVDWTQSTLNSMQIGYIISAAGTNRIQVTAIWALIESTLPIMAEKQLALNNFAFVKAGDGMSVSEKIR